jgi:hypothetical protein
VEEITIADSPPSPDTSETVKSPGGTTVLGKRKNGAEEVAEGVDEMIIDSQSPSSQQAPQQLVASPSAADTDMTDIPPSPSSASTTVNQDSQEPSSDERQPKRGRSLDPTRSNSTSTAVPNPSGPNPDVEVVPASPIIPAEETDEEMPPLLGGSSGPPLPPRPETKKESKEMEIQSYMAFGSSPPPLLLSRSTSADQYF